MENLRLPTKQTTGSPADGFLASTLLDTGDLLDATYHLEVPAGVMPLTFQISAISYPSTDRQDSKRSLELITDLGEAGYSLLRPIPVEIKKIGHEDFEASFRTANIAIGGTDEQDAYQALVADILNTYDVLTAEQTLGPDAAVQLRVLGGYIVRT